MTDQAQQELIPTAEELWEHYELAAWAPAEETTVSKHAEDHRVLIGTDKAFPGPWDNDRTPYLREIMDAMGDERYRVVVIKKPSQVGASESARNALFYWVRVDPGDCLIVFPDQDSAEEQLEKHLYPLMRSNLAEYLGDGKRNLAQKRIRTSTMDVFPAWASSPQKLASRACRYVIFDEVNKYKGWDGKEGSPIPLGISRTKTFGHRGKVVIISTPTTSDGQISVAFEECEEQREAVVPCPGCGLYQPLIWARVKYPPRQGGESRKAWIVRIKRESLSRYHCEDPECGHEWTDLERLRVIRQVKWRVKDGSVEGGDSVGFEFNVLVSSFVRMDELVAKFIKVKDKPGELQEFINQELGEEFREQEARVEVGILETKRDQGHPRFLVPEWASMVLAAADTQKYGYYYCVRAYGHNDKSRLLDQGLVGDTGELLLKTLDTQWEFEDFETEYRLPPLQTSYLALDARGGTAASKTDSSKTHEIYQLSLTNPKVRPFLGYSPKQMHSAQPIYTRNSPYAPKDHTGRTKAAYRVLRWLFNPDYWKDLLNSQMHDESHNWQVHEDITEDYIKQMTSEARSYSRKLGRATWMPKTEHADNHLWDAEVMLCALSTDLNLKFLPDLKTLRAQRQARVKRAQQAAAPKQKPSRYQHPRGQTFLANRR